MLPPSLQGYAPEVSGIAKTNAKVTISQSGRIIYETNVPAGPFRIQGLDSSVRGRLDVRVEAQFLVKEDGTIEVLEIAAEIEDQELALVLAGAEEVLAQPGAAANHLPELDFGFNRLCEHQIDDAWHINAGIEHIH